MPNLRTLNIFIMNQLLVSKQELIQQSGVTRPTFLKRIKILVQDLDCPFTYEDYKRGHFISKKIYNYIIQNL